MDPTSRVQFLDNVVRVSLCDNAFGKGFSLHRWPTGPFDLCTATRAGREKNSGFKPTIYCLQIIIVQIKILHLFPKRCIHILPSICDKKKATSLQLTLEIIIIVHKDLYSNNDTIIKSIIIVICINPLALFSIKLQEYD